MPFTAKRYRCVAEHRVDFSAVTKYHRFNGYELEAERFRDVLMQRHIARKTRVDNRFALVALASADDLNFDARLHAEPRLNLDGRRSVDATYVTPRVSKLRPERPIGLAVIGPEHELTGLSVNRHDGIGIFGTEAPLDYLQHRRHRFLRVRFLLEANF